MSLKITICEHAVDLRYYACNLCQQRDGDSTISHLQQSLRECEAQRDAALAREKWQPIETAPKSMKPIWLACVNGMRIGYWHQERWRDFFGEAPRYDILFTPTHWMPLPDLPTAVEPDEAALHRCSNCGQSDSECDGYSCTKAAAEAWQVPEAARCATCKDIAQQGAPCPDCTGRQAQKADKGSGG